MPLRAIYIGPENTWKGHFLTAEADHEYNHWNLRFDFNPTQVIEGIHADDIQIITEDAQVGTVWVIERTSDIERPRRPLAVRKCSMQAVAYILSAIENNEDIAGWPEEPQEQTFPDADERARQFTWINERNLVTYIATEMKVYDSQFELPEPTTAELDIPSVNLHGAIPGLSIGPSSTGSGHRIQWGDPIPASTRRVRRVA